MNRLIVYKPRQCECGTTYTPTSGTQKRCPECRKKHDAEYSRTYVRQNRKRWHIDPDKAKERNRRYRMRHPEKVCEFNRAYRAAHPEKEREATRRRREKQRLELLAAHDPAAAFRLLDLQGQIQECPRLHVRASSLPCGQRAECFGKVRCEKCPDEAMPPSGKDSSWAISAVGW